MEYHYTLLLVLLPAIFLVFLHSLFLSPKPKHSKLPPGPKQWPIIGNIHLLGNNPHHSITELSKIYGPFMSLKLGSITTIVISSPDIAKEKFLKHDLVFAGRNVPHSLNGVNHDKHSIAWLPICLKWRDLRKIVAIQLLTNQQLDASHRLRRKKVDELVDYARDYCKKGLAIDIGKAAFTTSLNLLSNTFF